MENKIHISATQVASWLSTTLIPSLPWLEVTVAQPQTSAPNGEETLWNSALNISTWRYFGFLWTKPCLQETFHLFLELITSAWNLGICHRLGVNQLGTKNSMINQLGTITHGSIGMNRNGICQNHMSDDQGTIARWSDVFDPQIAQKLALLLAASSCVDLGVTFDLCYCSRQIWWMYTLILQMCIKNTFIC